MPAIRRGSAEDLAAIAAIQAASPEAADWQPADYLAHRLLVAIGGAGVMGFVAARPVAEGEFEILNLAVAPEFRRQGIARELLEALFQDSHGTFFLEVRESNQAAQMCYKSLGFQSIGRRPGYYEGPSEAAIVMKFHSC
ncbi:MAG: ribosomal protein S18-alanine N-acetyltransferase [Bryobacteraceae bacterium]